MNDNELIYLIKTENLGNAKQFISAKYISYVNNYQRKLNAINDDCILSYNENLSDAYVALEHCLKNYNLKQNCLSFSHKLTLFCKFNAVSNVRKLTSDKRNVNNKIVDFKHEVTSKSQKQNLLNDNVEDNEEFQKIIKYLENKPPILKKIFKLLNVPLCCVWHRIV